MTISFGYVKLVMLPSPSLPFRRSVEKTLFRQYLEKLFLLSVMRVMITEGRLKEESADAHSTVVLARSLKSVSTFTSQNNLNLASSSEFTLKNTDGARWKIGHKTINVFLPSVLPDDAETSQTFSPSSEVSNKYCFYDRID